MSSNEPNTSLDSFNYRKFFDSCVLQQGVPVLDSDWNEQADIVTMRHMDHIYAMFGIGFFPTAPESVSPEVGFGLENIGPDTSNLLIKAGYASVWGAIVPTTRSEIPIDIEYTDIGNYMTKGFVSSVNGNQVLDDNKKFEAWLELETCQIYMLSGVETGNVFEVTTVVNLTTLECSGGIGSISAGDEYLILPPAIPAAVGVTWNKQLHVWVWWEWVNENEDPSITNPGVGIETCQRRVKRFCIRTTDSSEGNFDLHNFDFLRRLKVADLEINPGDTDITITRVENRDLPRTSNAWGSSITRGLNNLGNIISIPAQSIEYQLNQLANEIYDRPAWTPDSSAFDTNDWYTLFKTGSTVHGYTFREVWNRVGHRLRIQNGYTNGTAQTITCEVNGVVSVEGYYEYSGEPTYIRYQKANATAGQVIDLTTREDWTVYWQESWQGATKYSYPRWNIEAPTHIQDTLTAENSLVAEQDITLNSTFLSIHDQRQPSIDGDNNRTLLFENDGNNTGVEGSVRMYFYGNAALQQMTFEIAINCEWSANQWHYNSGTGDSSAAATLYRFGTSNFEIEFYNEAPTSWSDSAWSIIRRKPVDRATSGTDIHYGDTGNIRVKYALRERNDSGGSTNVYGSQGVTWPMRLMDVNDAGSSVTIVEEETENWGTTPVLSNIDTYGCHVVSTSISVPDGTVSKNYGYVVANVLAD